MSIRSQTLLGTVGLFALAALPPVHAHERPVTPTEHASTATQTLLTSADPAMPLGARLYLDNCSACHFVDGKGAEGTFPALDGNALVNADLA